ncbi:MAG: chromate resistance protein [Gemmatimonadetes bacterium]|nr:chromate resistance protein [Gemmatimonadota bacterium]
MNDSSATAQRQGVQAPPWLVFIHQIPPKPDYFRVKVRRRLRRIGAVALKNSVYVLPRSDDALEDLHWLRREIEADGGEAMICEATFVAGVTDGELMTRFAFDRASAAPAAAGIRAPDRVPPGHAWVTRERVFVDRIASAWLIRRFIDPEARFKFVAAHRYRPAADERRFDMFEAEYTHEGERCTFETLLHRFALADPALQAIAEIVHDIDCKDDKFGRPEAPGIATLLQGIAAGAADDAARVARGAILFEDLYARFTEPAV